MNLPAILRLCAACALSLLTAACDRQVRDYAPAAPSLAGSWTLQAADVIRPDGTRAHDYGADPKGLLIIDAQGRYSLQIYQSERPRFAAGDKQRATADEYRSAVLGASNHFGTLQVDAAAGLLIFDIQNSSYPNQEGTRQQRPFHLEGDTLSYRVPPRPDGSQPVSVWQRLK